MTPRYPETWNWETNETDIEAQLRRKRHHAKATNVPVLANPFRLRQLPRSYHYYSNMIMVNEVRITMIYSHEAWEWVIYGPHDLYPLIHPHPSISTARPSHWVEVNGMNDF